MPHISSKKIRGKDLKKLQNELVHSFERSFSKMKTAHIFNQFFTRTEKIMFAKRLAVIAMLRKDVSPYMISGALSMSPSTTQKMSAKYESGKYDTIICEALGKKKIWDIVESILSVNGIMPPKVGGGRWQRIDTHLRKKKLATD